MSDKRKFAKGHNHYGGWIAALVIVGIIIYIVVSNGKGLEYEPNRQILIFAGIVLVVGIASYFTRSVWVSGNSKYYHRYHGCCGANIKIRRVFVKSKGLEPCAKCHKIQKD